MKMLAIIFWLGLFGGAPQRVAPAAAGTMTQKDAKDFCEVMAAPKQFQGKAITLQASAQILYGGILLESSQCTAQQMTVHFMSGYEKESNATGLEILNRLRTRVREAALSGEGVKAERARASVVFEGRFDNNPYYHVEIARGDATLAAWDYNYQYAFVVTRIISVRPIE